MSTLSGQSNTKPFITITNGMRGWFAVQMWWNPDLNGFWEPWSTSPCSFGTKAEAIEDAKAWAENEDLAFSEVMP